MRRFVVLALIGLAACDGGGAPTPVQKIEVANPMHQQLLALSPANQGLGLRRAIMDSRYRCKRVEAHGFQQDHNALKMWVVRCSDASPYAVFLAPSGDVQVRRCNDAASLGLPACRLPEVATSDS